MSEPFIGEIRQFAGNFAPRGWAFCNGQLLPVSQNTALFSLLGTTYGGDGRTTMGLPNLQDRAPMHPGRGPGLTTRRLGETGGVSTVTLTEAQMPNHSHVLLGTNDIANRRAVADAMFARGGDQYHAAPADVEMNAQALEADGGSQAHNNMQPYLGMNYIIALVGLYPSRS